MSISDSSSTFGGATDAGPRLRIAIVVSLVSVTAVVLVAGFLLGHFGMPGQRYVTVGTPSEHTRQFYVFWEAWQQVEQKFYASTPPDVQTMTHGAIRGMLGSLEDPFTSFAGPAERRLESDTYQGDFGGIGGSLVMVDTQPTFVDIYAGSPAETAALQVGDRVLEVDGITVTALPLDQVVLLIRGPVGTPLQLKVQRGSEQALSLSVTRQRVELPSLKSQLLSSGVGYIGIQLFSARTGEELAGAIQKLQRQNAETLVLDLRGNGGGLTGGAIDVLHRLLGHGIAFRELRRGLEEERHAIPFGEPLIDWPMVVLVDGGTASAAEMVAAAIREYDRGILIGQRTYGKGSVQGVYQLSDGSSVHITTSRWLSANGRPIDGVGLAPDIVVDPSPSAEDTEDPFLRRAVDHLRQKLGHIPVAPMAPIDPHDSGKVVV